MRVVNLLLAIGPLCEELQRKLTKTFLGVDQISIIFELGEGRMVIIS